MHSAANKLSLDIAFSTVDKAMPELLYVTMMMVIVSVCSSYYVAECFITDCDTLRGP